MIKLGVSKLFQDGEQSVAPAQQSLFHKPEILRLQERTQQLEAWIHLVEASQHKRKLQLEVENSQ